MKGMGYEIPYNVVSTAVCLAFSFQSTTTICEAFLQKVGLEGTASDSRFKANHRPSPFVNGV